MASTGQYLSEYDIAHKPMFFNRDQSFMKSNGQLTYPYTGSEFSLSHLVPSCYDKHDKMPSTLTLYIMATNDKIN